MFINFNILEPLNASESLTIDSYNEIELYIKQYIDKGFKLDEYGYTNASTIWENGNKILYLVLLLSLIRDRVLKDYRTCNLKPIYQYREEYKLDCIRKTFSCFSIPFDVDPLYTIFGLNSENGFEGIEFDAVEIDSINACDSSAILEIF